jgi:Prokaryotic E2 family E
VGHVITLPQFGLPAGWNKSTCRVCFVAPQGYPYAKPDCFWTDHDLRLASQPGVPRNTGTNGATPELAAMLWFSWHTDQWNANRDDLLSWVASIRRRLSSLS